ncbi:hypothetical protein K502DRAFT_345419 [Neoconidiobolus thromboides FSU 785]|nr:hypothetical protein K502DRAFT_345419 [Neoconidiobolus thromboides FSU 785]
MDKLKELDIQIKRLESEIKSCLKDDLLKQFEPDSALEVQQILLYYQKNGYRIKLRRESFKDLREKSKIKDLKNIIVLKLNNKIRHRGINWKYFWKKNDLAFVHQKSMIILDDEKRMEDYPIENDIYVMFVKKY